MKRILVLCIASLVLLSACQSGRSERINTAYDIARSGNLIDRRVDVGNFLITTFERATEKNAPANIYIEGDGLAWLGRRTPSQDPTPINPVALRLAAADNERNVIYIARPCQYTKDARNTACSQRYWTSARFSQEIVSAMNKALDDIKSRYDITEFNIIGYSGGGAIAVLLTERRNDVASLRTVAGNLDTDAFSHLHHISRLSESLNPVKTAPRIAHIPQRHFTGSQDTVITEDIVSSYTETSNNTGCVHSSVVINATHETGWPEQWPELLSYPVTCKD